MQNFPIMVLLPLILFLGSLTLVQCQPYEAYPVDKQYPPVARVDEAFSFQLSNDTFKSSVNEGTQITYNAYDLPGWLTFDSSSRILSGTANSSYLSSEDETLYFTFTLEGTDPSDQSQLNESYQLVLTNQSSVEVASNFNILALLKNYGSTNGKSGLILTPKEIFNVTFDRSTFTSEDPIVAYYGRSQQYNAPLPNWLYFDSNNLKFSGTAPVVNSNIAPQVTYSFVLTATDIEGFSGVSVPFDLVIGAHELTTSVQNSLVVNVTNSGDFSYDVPLNYVYLDNEVIQSDKLGSLQLVDAPSWVTLDNATLSGTMPKSDSSSNSGNFSVAVYDVYDDVVYLNFNIESTDKLFAVSSLSNINATRGEWFQYSFLPSQFTDFSNTSVSTNYTNSSQNHDWINFKTSNLTLSGTVPDEFDFLAMELVATEGSVTQALDFQIIGMDTIHNSTQNSTSSSSSAATSSSSTSSVIHATSSQGTSTTTSAPSSSEAAAGSAPLKKTSNKTTAVACGVAIPLGLIAIAAIIFLLFWRRRGKRDPKDDTEKSPSISGPNVNNPANRPNQDVVIPVNPFDDDNSSLTSSAKRLGALNAMKLDGSSCSDSDTSTVNEKHSSFDDDDLSHDAFHSQSAENLLEKPPASTEFIDPQNRSSSVYLDSEPANRKSWRYKLNPSVNDEARLRDSCISTSTVSTTELLNTVIKEDQQLPKDPRKSTLGLRDSVFWERNSPTKLVHSRPGVKFTSESDVLPILNEHSHVSSEYKSSTTPSSSSSDEFIPVKEGDNYNWVHRPKPDRQPSKKRLVQTQNQSTVDVGQAAEVEGHFPEEI